MFNRLLANLPNSTMLVITVSALFLTLIAGLFLSLGAVLGVMIFGPAAAKAAPSAFLLIVAIVLLIVVIILLLALLVCTGCFSKGRGEAANLSRLLALLPLVGSFKATLLSLASALQSIETMLSTVETTLNNTTDAVAGIDLPSVPVPSFETPLLAESFDETSPVGGPIHALLDAIEPDALKPRTIANLTTDDQPLSLAFLHDVFSTEPFEQNIETIADARAKVQTLANLLP